MKKFFHTDKILKFITAFIAVLFILASCDKKVDVIKKTDVLSMPLMTVKDFRSVVDDSGKVQLILVSPLMQEYKGDDSPYREFTAGLQVFFYDGHKEPIGIASSKYAKYIEKKSLWELRDSVVVVNESKDKLETEQLFWDQEKQLIYTDRFVKISNEDQVVFGSGFESDIRLTKRKIKNVSGPIYLHDE